MELLREDDLYRMDLLVRQLLASRSKRSGQPSIISPPLPAVPARPAVSVEPTTKPEMPNKVREEKARKDKSQSSSSHKSPYLESSERLPSGRPCASKALRLPPPHLPVRDSSSSKATSSRLGSAIRRPNSAAAATRNLHPSQVSASALKAYAWFD